MYGLPRQDIRTVIARAFRFYFIIRNLGAFFAVWEFASQIPKPQKTGLSATSPRICLCKSCGLSATIPCAWQQIVYAIL
jgi:hypothetical protein